MQAANALYEFMAKCVLELLHRCVAWPIENAANSLLWCISFVAALEQMHDVKRVEFQHCAFGGGEATVDRLCPLPGLLF